MVMDEGFQDPVTASVLGKVVDPPSHISEFEKVIGVPLPTSDLKGIDSLYSIVQMPGGVPVACVGIGVSGAKNAALLAAQILGLKYKDIKDAYEKYKQNLANK